MSGNIHVLSNQLVYEEVRHCPHQTEHQVSRNARADDFAVYRRGTQDEPQQIHDDESNRGDSCDEKYRRRKPYRPKVPYTAIGSADKIVYDYVMRCFNAIFGGAKEALGAGPSLGHRFTRFADPTGLIRNTLIKTTTARHQPMASRHLILISSDSNI
jgi:hypothetical protein